VPTLVAHRLGLHLLCPLLTSDRASRHLSMPVALTGTTARSPRVLRTHLHAYACRIYVAPLPCKFWALVNWATSPQYDASYPLPVRQASALPSGFLQTRSHPRNPCLWLTLPLAGRVEDFHLQVSAPCRAHPKKSGTEVPLNTGHYCDPHP
jgi:hypothetical protein